MTAAVLRAVAVLPISEARLRLLLELVKYGLGSAVALMVDYGLLVLLTETVGLHYLLSATLSFLAGMAVAYVLSVTVVFGERRERRVAVEIAVFVGIGLIGLGLNQVVLGLLVDGLGLGYALAKLPTAGIVFLFNFGARRAALFSAAPAR